MPSKIMRKQSNFIAAEKSRQRVADEQAIGERDGMRIGLFELLARSLAIILFCFMLAVNIVIGDQLQTDAEAQKRLDYLEQLEEQDVCGAVSSGARSAGASQFH